MRSLTSQKPAPSAFNGSRSEQSSAPEPVRGAYQPVGKVDIAAIRAQAKQSGQAGDDRPSIVKGSYEPVGKVDIAAIRARAQPPSGGSSCTLNSVTISNRFLRTSLQDRYQIDPLCTLVAQRD